MRKRPFRLVLFFLIYLSLPLTATAQIVDIPDPNLRAVIEQNLGKAPGATITVAEMAALTELEAPNTYITDLTGLKHATNLTKLDLGDALEGGFLTNSNSISDISPLAGLNQLTELDLWGNSISDISIVAGLTNLTQLDLALNAISDISPLAGLNQLTELDLWDNSISDISLLAGLTNLTELHLQVNSISDISPLVSLNNLTQLDLSANPISDISPLASLNNLIKLDLSFNPISDLSPLASLNNLTTLSLLSTSISDISAIAELTNLEELDLAFNSISDLSPLAALTQLTDLTIWHNSISDISPLAGLTNLTTLSLWSNSISDISAIAELTNLRVLLLRGNSISDLSPLVENMGLGEENWVDVTENPLNAASINIHIPALQSRGVAVAFDDIVAQPADVNSDGSVNILDLVSVAFMFGTQGQNLPADVNRDEVVDILDLVLVAGVLGEVTAAPSAHLHAPETPTAAEVRQWLTDAKALEVRGPIMKRGVVVLQQILASLTPTETELLANYPNPFNPETWIPYRLAEDALVTLTIYDLNGQVVRTINVGHQTAAIYENRSKAVYWDGRNGLGEQVASGVYFYHLSAGKFSATRKMVILK